MKKNKENAYEIAEQAMAIIGRLLLHAIMRTIWLITRSIG